MNRPTKKIPQLWTPNSASKDLNTLREDVAAKIIAYIPNSAICTFPIASKMTLRGAILGRQWEKKKFHLLATDL